MITLIDGFLNKITMYRLVLYILTGMLIGALVLSALGILPHDPVLLLLGGVFIILISLIFNKILAYLFGAKTNEESVYITALILTLIVAPVKDIGDFPYWIFLFSVSALAMASKYFLAIKKKHVFNPAALAVVVTFFTLNQSASWWIGTPYMAPLVIIGGLLITRKLREFDLVLTFILIALAPNIILNAPDWNTGFDTVIAVILDSPLLFFAFIMLTEPQTTPPTRRLRMFYGAIAGILFSPFIHIGRIYSTPELALLVSNVFSYIVSPKQKLILKLKEKVEIANAVYDFVFSADKKLAFRPGQYLEWTISPEQSDARGNRRFFTIASSPTEEDIHIGIKFYNEGSSFKRKLYGMRRGDSLIASGLAGEFVLPTDPAKKLAFIAGGIGVTPFRSMIKYLLDTGEKRDIVMLYSNKAPSDVAYRDLINEAGKSIGLKTVYTITDIFPAGGVWNDRTGFIDAKMIKEEIPDYLNRHFYLSGTHGMVVTFDKMLRGLGVPRSQIKKDFFPGYV